MIKNFDIITIGGATQDIMYYTDRAVLIKNKKNVFKQELLAFEYGGKISSDDVNLTYGGGGMNTAVSCSLLGLRTASILNLGSDWFAKEIFKELKNKKIDTSLVSFDKKLYSGFSFIINYGDYHEHIIFTHRGSNQKLRVEKNILSRIISKWIYVSSLSGEDKLLKNNIDNIFSDKTSKIAWNPGEAQLKKGYKFFKQYLKSVELFILNKDEAMDLVRSFSKKTSNMNALLKTIYSWGPKMVLITSGHLGAHFYDGKNIYYQKAILVKSINTTGAGDAFGSSFVSALIMNYPVKKALKFAMIRSCNVLRHIGAQTGLLSLNQIKKIRI
jgi:ribokinase